MHRSVVTALGLAFCLALSACSTYVNIPAQPGDVARSNPNDRSVVAIMGAALEAVAADRPMDQFAIVLPPGTEPANYDLIVPRVAKGAVWFPEGVPAGMPVLEIRQVRQRTMEAQVDIIRPAMADDMTHQELVTAYLKLYPVGGWSVQNLRVWRGSLENALRESAQMETGVAP